MPGEAELDELGRRWDAAMRAGDWEAAWRETDRIERPRRARAGARRPQELVWDGTPFEGRSVLVRGLHGLGDTLQFMRFVPLLAQQARELHFLVQPALIDLLHGLPGLGHVASAWTDTPPAHEVEIEVMELAYALRSTPATLPPPLRSLAPRVAQRQRFVLPVPGEALRIGLLWAASEWDPARSIPLRAFAPIVRAAGARWYSLQQGPGADDPLVQALGIMPLHRHTREVASAAAAMLEMDAVVCCDGMPAHLAATLGVPTWLLLQHQADWRWGHGERTPWYHTMRIVRQPRAGDWDGALAQLAVAIGAAFRPSAG